MILARRLYSFWCYLWFLGVFLILFPFFVLFLQKPAWYRKAHYLNRLWGQIFFPACFMPIHTEFRGRIDPEAPYVFCANHTSYLDIAAMGVVLRNFYAFIGKEAIAKVPLFGYMFRRLHIPVNRDSRASGYEVVQRATQLLHQRRSIVIFPEGGIKSKNPPRLASFKDGAFKMAIQAQVPIVPISFPYNWMILPDDRKLLFRRHRIVAIVHEPIPTTGLTLDDLESLKKRTFDVINRELHRYFPEGTEQLAVSSKQ
jgi:1-acyl-sn-glycerol-3-phosphate acyltransferase